MKKTKRRAKIPSFTSALPTMSYDIIKAPFTSMRPMDFIKRDKPIMLPTSRLLYTLYDSTKHPNRIKVNYTKIEKPQTRKIVESNKKGRMLKSFNKNLKLGVPTTLESYLKYELSKK